MEPTILYEDTYILAVNKPSGLIIHADGRSEEMAKTDLRMIIVSLTTTATVSSVLLYNIF